MKRVKKKIKKIFFGNKPNSAWTKIRMKNEILKYGFEIGDHTYGLPKTLYGAENSNLIIGKYCSFGENVKIYLGGNHNIKRATTYPFGAFKRFWSLSDDYNEVPISKGSVIVGSDVWIADDVTILSGVNIGHGAVIGNKSLVTKDVPPYCIVAGNPARIIKKRFGEEVISKLLEISWWNMDDVKVKEIIPYLLNENVEEFIKKCSEAKC